MPSNVVLVNNRIKFVVPDAKMPALMDMLYEVATQGKHWSDGHPADKVEELGEKKE